MNKDKIIKDLKERNDKLANQRRQFEIRLINEQYLVEKKDKEIERLNNIMQQMIEYIEYSLKNNKSGEREVLQIVLAKLKVELKEGKE